MHILSLQNRSVSSFICSHFYVRHKFSDRNKRLRQNIFRMNPIPLSEISDAWATNRVKCLFLLCYMKHSNDNWWTIHNDHIMGNKFRTRHIGNISQLLSVPNFVHDHGRMPQSCHTSFRQHSFDAHIIRPTHQIFLLPTFTGENY